MSHNEVVFRQFCGGDVMFDYDMLTNFLTSNYLIIKLAVFYEIYRRQSEYFDIYKNYVDNNGFIVSDALPMVPES